MKRNPKQTANFNSHARVGRDTYLHTYETPDKFISTHTPV